MLMVLSASEKLSVWSSADRRDMEGRFDKLKISVESTATELRSSIAELGRSVARLEGAAQKQEPYWKAGILGALLVAAIGLASWSLKETYGLNGRVSKLEGLSQKVATLEAERQTVADLAVANVQTRTDLLKALPSGTLKATPEFFAASVDAVRKAVASGADLQNAHSSLVSLATWRSQLPKSIEFNGTPLEISEEMPTVEILKFANAHGFLVAKNGTIASSVNPIVSTDGRPTIYVNVRLEIGPNPNFENALFVDSTIVYRSGPVRFNNVRFVRCKFEVPQTKSALPVLEYAALDSSSSLTLTGN